MGPALAQLPALVPEGAAVVVSYLLGSVPFGLLFARVKGVDLRRFGSGNIGATNTGRALGRGWGLAAFALDFGKGWLPTAVLAPQLAGAPERVMPAAVACGASAVLGHCFPIYLRLRGGKGVATGCGAIVGIDPLVFLAGGAAWLVTLAVWRYVSLASLVMGAAFPLAAWIRRPEEPIFLLGASLLTLLIFLRHRANLRRLLSGTEPRLGAVRAKGTLDA